MRLDKVSYERSRNVDKIKKKKKKPDPGCGESRINSLPLRYVIYPIRAKEERRERRVSFNEQFRVEKNFWNSSEARKWEQV